MVRLVCIGACMVVLCHGDGTMGLSIIQVFFLKWSSEAFLVC